MARMCDHCKEEESVIIDIDGMKLCPFCAGDYVKRIKERWSVSCTLAQKVAAVAEFMGGIEDKGE